jgi:hypothetical protein
MSVAGVAILVPVLRRPHRVRPLVENISATTPAPFRVVFVCSPNDRDELAAVKCVMRDHPVTRVVTDQAYERGDYARKINLAYQLTDELYMFLGADDLRFYPKWLELALERMADGIGVVGTNDLGNQRVIAGTHATHSLVARAYVDEHGTIDEPGKVLHEGYWHEFVDDEFVATARRRNAFAFAGDSHVEHLHPNWGKGEPDELYAMQHVRMRVGRKLYRRRESLWTSP